jgi:large subunit ribosomal protein L3
MSIGIVGRKCGMTRVFRDDGVSIPVTLVEAKPNRITQIKTLENDGYTAIQVACGHKRASLLTKPIAGHYAKAKVEAGSSLWEFRIVEEDLANYTVGGEVTVGTFTEGQIVDVAGISKGKGFAGTIKRHHFTMGDATHGNSLSHRSPGSIGQRQTPGRVFKGKKMSGHLGNTRRSMQNLVVVKVDAEKHLIAIKGSVPGAPGGELIIRPAAKA